MSDLLSEHGVKGHLSSLLAIIHRDGGHYEREHGTEKAVEDAEEALAELKTKLSMIDFQLEWIENILDGHEASDFAMSFPIVRRVWDLKQNELREDTDLEQRLAEASHTKFRAEEEVV